MKEREKKEGMSLTSEFEMVINKQNLSVQTQMKKSSINQTKNRLQDYQHQEYLKQKRKYSPREEKLQLKKNQMVIASNTRSQTSQVENENTQKEKARRQENHTVEIRKKKRLDTLKKNRMRDKSAKNCLTDRTSTRNTPLYQQSALSSLKPATRGLVEKIYQIEFKYEQIKDLVKALNSKDVLQQYYGCISLRKLLSEDNSPIQIVIKAKCVPRFIEFIKQTDYPVLQLEAAWCLSNIASGTTTQTASIVDKGAIPLLVQLLASHFSDVSEKAILGLGNIARDYSVYRDKIIKCNGVKPLANILLKTQDKKIIKHASWALSNLCRGRPPPQFQLVKEAISPLCKVFQQETDSETLTDISWAICYLSDGDEDRIQLLIDTGIIPSLIKHIDHQELISVLIPCLRSIGLFCIGSESQTDAVIGYGAVAAIFKLVQHQNKIVRREACWTLSNIAVGNAQLVALIVSENSQIESLIQCIISDSEDVSREAAWAISNCTSQANPQEIFRLVDLKILEIYSHKLKTSQDSKTLAVILESLKHILECGDKDCKQGSINPFIVQLKSLGAKETIKNLQKYPDKDNKKRSLILIKRFF